MLHYYPRHVSSINMPIFRRTNYIHTASGIVALCKRLHSTPVESRLLSTGVLCSHKTFQIQVESSKKVRILLYLKIFCSMTCFSDRSQNKLRCGHHAKWRLYWADEARNWIFLLCFSRLRGTRRRSWLRHCATSRKVAGSIPDSVIGIFHSHNPSGRTMALGSTQPLAEMSTRNVSWGG